LKKSGFKARLLSSTLLSWQYNRVYRHLKKLSHKGYISIEKNQFSKINYYWITYEGQAIIRAFSQHYWQIFDEVRERLGEFPPTFDSVLP
jgi:DNA-binding MarR family transcriptional regulator